MTCGNGKLDKNEQCDGSVFATQFKKKPQLRCVECVAEYCGDAVRNGPESCDDGNLITTDQCTNSCLAPQCGDGILSSTEKCDGALFAQEFQGKNIKTCVACEPLFCGDGVKNSGEMCDDGNNDNNDLCTTMCKPPICGDGFVQTGEGCDDGNTSNFDSCLNTCQPNTCGDGIRDYTREQCDDGNKIDSDDCLSSCMVNICGDGIRQPAKEQCDDGNLSNADTCTNRCTIPFCGDGVVSPGESCDDGNTSNSDSCLVGCTRARCGDGIVWAGKEQCDDGNVNNTDSCLNNCTIKPVCGNGIKEAGEECDFGYLNYSKGCDPTRCVDTCKNVPAPLVQSNIYTISAQCFPRRSYVSDGQGMIAAESNQCWICVIQRTTNGCFDPDSQLQRADGTLVRAADLRVGELLLNPITRKHLTVSDIVESRESMPMIALSTKNGTVKVTSGHPILTKRGVIRADAVRLDDYVFNTSGSPESLTAVTVLPIDPNQRVVNFRLSGASSDDLTEHLVSSDGIVTGDLVAQLALGGIDE